ncbi:IclR family transcriptional regulator [Roseibium marinum]|uniref:DNA-binding IclR family transcriptional regulator n=1 Tax=Roseibium marinum TaxID=281252 RepID=A0A2S3V278_9HYPH|nr:IclR family transcriptional regulator [Roseibium marinum]POF34084.1 DNA-binding IclR family transcriptional regulator [Roseibium marinum]
MPDARRKRTSGIDRSLQIMDVLTDGQKPMTAYELSKATKAPISTVYRLVDELVERDMLSRGENSAIWLGPRLMRYGLVYRANMDMFSEARREMNTLCQRTGETVQICGRDGDMMVVLAMANGDGHFRVTSDVGTRVPLNWTASGRLLLGHLPDEERVEIFSKSASPSETGRAEIDPSALAKQSRADFEANLAIQISNSEYSVACIAAPIRDMSGACVLTMSVVLSEQRARERKSELVDLVQKSALAVERVLGSKAA